MSFLALSLFALSCSNNEDNTPPQQNNPIQSKFFSPPSWIIGTWVISGTTTQYFKFSNEDFILLTPYTSYKTVLEQTKSAGQTAKVDETITDIDYNFVITVGASSGSYKFKKVNATKIQWINGINNITLDKE
ncbi:hypothetical protein [Chryseobacterium jejuense]|uniref:hypothetical protein n=1 Tax=Chryseobacterium jejuense TaxID=445960 RepID=UPI001AE5A091|nr:hypothetical protein [Chryseobacterium jejuense]